MESPILRKLAIRLAVLAVVIGAFGLGVDYGMSKNDVPPKKDTTQYAISDLNKDGKVNAIDLSLFLKNYPKTHSDQEKGKKIEIQL